MPERRVIDPHVHVWKPEYIPPTLRMSWAQGASIRKSSTNDETDSIYPRVSQDVTDAEGDNLLAAMDIGGVDHSVIVGVDYGEIDGRRSRVPNRVISAHYQEICKRSGGRLSWIGGIDPLSPMAPARADEMLSDPSCLGLKFYPPSGFSPADPRCTPIYQLLVEWDKIALFHTAAVRGSLQWRYSWPVLISDVQVAHQDLKIVLAHSGYSCWWDECVALAANHPRTYLELSLWQRLALRRPQVFADSLARARDLVGADRILFASDTMYGSKLRGAEDEWKAWVAYFRNLSELTGGDITDDEAELFLSGNASKLFGI